MLDASLKKSLEEKALRLRELTILEIAHLGSGHIGGSMSIIEALTYLYYKAMNIDPANPHKEDRDRFVCSKGHAGPAVYATLADKGYFPMDWLNTLNQGGTNLPSHCDMNKTPGIDFTTGSLGQGTSAAVGIALGQRLKGQKAYTYLMIGDGESQEGQVWEAAEAAAQFKLDNLIAFTDLNGQQLDGYTKDIMCMDNLDLRYKGFNWDVQSINGHDFDEIAAAIEHAKSVKGKPHMIILHTIKSKGFAPGEGVKSNHSMAFGIDVANQAIAKLKEEAAK
ncbi:MAG: transketolase [Sphaerochaetaceae bacterium]|jgi:transketolase|nr:transketolase [Sphaerochaetaceae bacterium]